MRVLNRAASEVLVAHGDRRPRPTSPGSGCSGTVWRWPAGPGRGSCSRPTALPALAGALALAAAGVETGGAAHNRRFVLPALTVGPRGRAGARHPRPRPADLRRAARRGRARERLAAVRAALGAAGVEHWPIGRVEPAGPDGRPASSSRDRRPDPGLQRGAPDRAPSSKPPAEHLPVIVVDDGSTDGTADAARAAGADVIEQRPNQGKGAALRAGFRRALAGGAEAILTLDADGQHDPDEIPAFLAAWARRRPTGPRRS